MLSSLYSSFSMYFNMLTLLVCTTLFMNENQSCCTGSLAFDNVNLKTWSRYFERLDEEFIERSGT